MNAYTLCLLEILDGRRREAIRWLCHGLSYNLHLPELVLARKMEPESDHQSGVIVGGEDEAAEYLQQNQSWRSKEPRVFLRRVLATRPIAERLQRARELSAELDSRDELAKGKKRSAIVEELTGLFDEKATRAILEEHRNAL